MTRKGLPRLMRRLLPPTISKSSSSSFPTDEGKDAGGDVADDGSFGITRDGVQQATDDMNAIFKDGVKMAAEFKGAFDDIKSALDFSSLLK